MIHPVSDLLSRKGRLVFRFIRMAAFETRKENGVELVGVHSIGQSPFYDVMMGFHLPGSIGIPFGILERGASHSACQAWPILNNNELPVNLGVCGALRSRRMRGIKGTFIEQPTILVEFA